MKNHIKLYTLAVAIFYTSIVQAQTVTLSDTTNAKKIEHHIGIQMNELVRQVFNFGNYTI
jgi:hypothetical protein